MSLTLASSTSDQHAAHTRAVRAARVDVAIVCSVGAAFAHLVAAPGHYLWWPASGMFFVALGVAQLVVAVALVYSVDNRWFVLATLWGTVAVIGVYIVSRTIGLPGTPPVPFHGTHWVAGRSILPDGAKHVGPLDLFTLVAELGVVATMLAMLPSPSKARAINQLMVLGIALSTAGFVALLT
jgi:hypothetical protein